MYIVKYSICILYIEQDCVFDCIGHLYKLPVNSDANIICNKLYLLNPRFLKHDLLGFRRPERPVSPGTGPTGGFSDPLVERKCLGSWSFQRLKSSRGKGPTILSEFHFRRCGELDAGE